jgi:hypothetical protein
MGCLTRENTNQQHPLENSTGLADALT